MINILEILGLEKFEQLIEKWLFGLRQFQMPTMINPILSYWDIIPYQLRYSPRLVFFEAIASRYGEFRGFWGA